MSERKERGARWDRYEGGGRGYERRSKGGWRGVEGVGGLVGCRYLQAFLDAYEEDGWGGSGHRKLKPTQVLAAAARSVHF